MSICVSQPVPITFPNIDNLEPGGEVDIWSLDPNLGEFGVVGTGRVSTDGQRIETISGGIVRADWHAPAPGPPLAPSEPIGEPDPRAPCDCPKAPIESTVTLSDGRLSQHFRLPTYRSLEQNRSLRFIYQSHRADPVPILPTAALIGAVTPTTISALLEVGGVTVGEEVFADASSLAGSAVRDIRISVAFDAGGFPSGYYPTRLRLGDHGDEPK